MKKFFLLLVVLLASTYVFPQKKYKMIVETNDGTTHEFITNNIIKTTFIEIEAPDNSQEEPGEEIINAESIRANYEKEFIKTFGVIIPYQDWGFKKTTNDSGESDGIRIIAEDLISKDFDFNDVVFDINWLSEGAEITLQAVGTTLPITIADREVHELFGVKVDQKVNTTVVDKNPVTFLIPYDEVKYGDANSIPIKVLYKGQSLELQASMGLPPTKIAVGIDYNWCHENESIESVYPGFKTWIYDNTYSWY